MRENTAGAPQSIFAPVGCPAQSQFDIRQREADRARQMNISAFIPET
jgi:hypothetical protein